MTNIPVDNKVILVCNIVEELDLENLLSTCSKRGRKPVVDLLTMLKIVLFCYSERIYSTRDIEKFCKFDLRARYILNGQHYPDHSTIDRFILKLNDFAPDILNQFVDMLIETDHINMESIYIDGTKIESFANKYTFVWRKSVEKNLEKLLVKVKIENNISPSCSLEDVVAILRIHLKDAKRMADENSVEFVRGKGRRKTELQKKIEYYEGKINKINEYLKHLEIMDERNSYSKTDHDATFMRMKEDHMLNGQLKPGYNIQYASTGTFIVGVYGSQKANDLNTLIPLLDDMLKDHSKYIKNIVCDAGYESEENYTYLENHDLESYIKPANYKESKKKKASIGRRENMEYIPEKDAYKCANGKLLLREKDQTRGTRSGFVSRLYVYKCEECSGCGYSKECISSRFEDPKSKTIKYSPEYVRQRERSLKNITSSHGIDLRVNRSIQAEGAFSYLKDGMRFRRFRHKGMKNVISQMILMALGINVNRLMAKIKNNNFENIEYKAVA